jgi:TonB-linked SusC/RagA family outer membrane protein
MTMKKNDSTIRWWSTILFLVGIWGGQLSAQSVSGQVTDAESGEALIGVSIQEEGTGNGTVTDADGRYTINVTKNPAVLVFSYVGYTSTRQDYTGQATIDVPMNSGEQLSEIIVTSLGISKEKKALSYAAQNVKTEEIAQARDLNVINSLSGKVAGLSIARSGSGVGAASRVILRGNRSIAGNSEPLYIVDGVPILGDLTTINPDDIESISVLKGANAAALYGSRAQNGAIVINTKKGSEGFKVSLNTSYTADSPLFLKKYQTEYGQGNGGVYSAGSEQAWGPKLNGGSVAHWSRDPNFPTKSYPYSSSGDPVGDFFQTGHNLATSLAISGGSAKTQTYFSYTYTDASGIVPTNDLKRHNAHIRINNKVNKKLSLEGKLNFIRQDIGNQLAQGEDFSNPVRHALRILPNIRTEDLEQFEYTTATGQVRQHYYNPGSNGGANPYWTINRNLRENSSDRIIGLVSMKYDFTSNFSLMLRSALDRIFGQSNEKFYNDSYIIANNGRFVIGQSQAAELNHDFLASYNKQLTKDISLSLNAGGNLRRQRNSSISSNTGDGLTVPNFFAITNTQLARTSYNIGSPKDVNSVYAFANVGYKNAIYLDITARNDWSSTLPKDNASYFYPSFGLSAVLSELTTFPKIFDFVKVRASYAQVGNDTNPYQLDRTATLSPGGANGFLTLSSTLPNANLKPEKTTSLELGAEVKMWQNRLGLDLTYYKSNTVDQLFSIALPIGSGAGQFFTNGGDVQNSGIEAVLNFGLLARRDFTWNVGFNFTKNQSKVLKINDERPRVNFGADFMRAFFVEQGLPWGNVYSRGFQKDAQGRVIVGTNGLPKITPGLTELVANFNPDWLGGFSNNITWKNFNLSALIDIRQGGSTVSLTDAIVFGDGLTQETVSGRDGTMVFGETIFSQYDAVKEDGTPNNIKANAEAFWQLVGGRNAPVGEAFRVDASNIRLREFVLGYKIPIQNNTIKGARVSIVGRNLFFFSNKAKTLDPEQIVGTATSAEGFESFAPPTTRSFGVNLQLDF